MPTPPKENPVHRGPRVGVQLLPAEGRKGDPPAWPLPVASEDELEAWAQLWATPQAVAWERLGWIRTVARYCRLMLLAEDPEKGTAAMHAQATALEDRLGLTPKAMRLLLWKVVEDEVGTRRGAGTKAAGSKGRSRTVRAVDASGS